MEITKLVTLFSLISLSLCGSFSGYSSSLKDSVAKSKTSTSKPSGSQNYGLYRKLNNLTKNLKQCFCYLQKQTGKPITQILSSGGENLERLVVYLYKDPTSEDIKIFLPNNEKQTMIPDLAFDKGDHLISSSENVRHVFNQFPDLITKRMLNEFPDIAQIIIPNKYNKKKNNLPVNTQEPNIDVVMPNNAFIKPDKLNLLDFDPNVNNDDQVLIQTEPANSYTLHLIPVHNDRPQKKLEILLPNITSNIFAGNETEVHNVNIGLSDEDIMTNDEFQEEEIKPDEELDVMNDDIIIPIKNEASNGNDIVEYETEQPILNVESTPKPEINKIKTDVSVQINDPSLKDIVFTELPFISNNVGDDHGTLISINKFVKPVQSEELSNDQKQEPVPIYNHNGPQTEKYWHYNNQWLNLPTLEDSNVVQNPFIYNTIIKSKGREHSQEIPLEVDENVTPVDHKWTIDPVEYINKKLRHEEHINPQEISIIAMHPETLVKKYQNSNDNDLRDTFDNWFNKQMKRVQFTNSRASNLLDIYTFKYLIEKTLREKGMQITKEGLIIDSDGNVLQTSNLGLRPILIGNSVEYKNLLQGKFSTFKLPTNLPYLEAVLITSINPPKILGIIPLGKTFLPKSSQKSLSLYVDDDASPRSICGGGCNGRRKIVMPSVNSIQTEGYFVQPGYKTLEPKTTNNQYSHRIFPFDQVDTIFDKIYKIPITENKVISVPRHYVIDTEPVISTRPVVKFPVTKISPRFRIIGGNAATSSGTPLNNKGRSGFESSESSMESADSEI